MGYDFDKIRKFAKGSFENASGHAHAIPMSVNSGSVKYARSKGGLIESVKACMLEDDPEYCDLDIGEGIAADATILSVDLRRSSDMALRIGPRHTHLTMHTYLPTMALLVQMAKGLIVGYRGDGLIAAFGIVDHTQKDKDKASKELADSITTAVDCGKAMLEAVDDIINPILHDGGVKADLIAGIGIDLGSIVITNIGLRDADEVTAYGHPVNKACHLSCEKNNGQIHITQAVKSMFPTQPGGRLTFDNFFGNLIVKHPQDYQAMKNRARIGKAK